jgi:hypothetical protein
MNVERLPGGRIRVPVRATGPGGEIGEALATIGPDDPAYPVWDRWLSAQAGPESDEVRH